MKRFLKVILILAAVFGVAGLGLTAGGAAMGAGGRFSGSCRERGN